MILFLLVRDPKDQLLMYDSFFVNAESEIYVKCMFAEKYAWWNTKFLLMQDPKYIQIFFR